MANFFKILAIIDLQIMAKKKPMGHPPKVLNFYATLSCAISDFFYATPVYATPSPSPI